MYGAIFSEKDLYECQVSRLMERVSTLSKIYRDKAALISRVNCNSNLNADLLVLENAAKGYSSSKDLSEIKFIAEEIESLNSRSTCKLW
jgi:hypothetical protein